MSDMRNISTHPGGFQVRFRRNGDLVSEYFAVSIYGSEARALAKAKDWRDLISLEIRANAPQRPLKSKTTKSKWRELPVGVCQLDRPDRAFVVNWIDTAGKPKQKCFAPGRGCNTAQIEHARNTAIAFRLHFAYCRETGLTFTPDYYQDWRTDLKHPFRKGIAKRLANEHGMGSEEAG